MDLVFKGWRNNDGFDDDDCKQLKAYLIYWAVGRSENPGGSRVVMQ